MQRILTWLLALALSAAGMVATHALAYRLTGAPAEGVHAYLEHAPQLLAVLTTLTLGALACTSRSPRLRHWPFPALALSGFVAMEHVERVAHTGELPWLLTRPAFLAGLALQVPVALAVWLLARRLLRAVTDAARRRRPPRVLRGSVAIPLRPQAAPAGRSPLVTASRGPPLSLQAC